MNPTIKKWVVKPVLILFAMLLVLFGIGFFVLTTQQNKLVNVAITELNNQFRGELVIHQSSISFIENFPQVSIALHNVEFFNEKNRTGKPLYSVERVYAGFSIADFFAQKYNVRQITLRNGYLDLIQHPDGELNLLRAKNLYDTSAATTTGAEKAFAGLTLEKITLDKMNISFVDERSGYRYFTKVESITSSFSLDSILITASANGSMEVDVRSQNDSTFFRRKHLVLDVVGNYHQPEMLLDIDTCHFIIEEAGFTVHGSADFKDTTNLNLRVIGDKQDFKLLSAFVPKEVNDKIKQFAYDGQLHFDARITGKVADNTMPHIEVSFGCENGWVQNTSAKKKVEQLGFQGFFTNGPDRSSKTSELRITNVHARPDKGVFKGNFVLRDFTSPQTLIQINSQLELQFLGDFLGIDLLKQTTGTIHLDMNFRELADAKLPEESLSKLKEGIQSKLVVENLSFRIPGYPHAVQNVNLTAAMEDGRVTVDSVSFMVGGSDVTVNGSISDVRNFLRHREQPVQVLVNIKSNKLQLHELVSYDTALTRMFAGEEVTKFEVGLALETSMAQLINPSPLPKGTLEMKNLSGAFKVYPHTFKNISATLMIADTTLRLRNLTGAIDSSDFNFSGRVNNYALWFDEIKKGKTQIAFDFKANRFALQDVFSRTIRQYLPRGYRREMLKNAWLRTKIDLRYDTTFRFAKAKIANVSGELVRHKLKLNNISGHVKYGKRVLVLDTMRGSIGHTDFDFTLKYYNGPDRNMQKRTNYLKFTSAFIDADEISQYDLAPKTGPRRIPGDSAAAVVAVDSSKHAEAFNIFIIPFSDFNAEIDIGKVKYSSLWLNDVQARIRMQEDHNIFIDTLRMKISDGTVALNGHLNGMDPKRIYFRSKIDVDQVDLEKMMLKLDNFGQDVVINKNIKGRISGQIKSYVQIHPDLVPILRKTKADLKVTIYDGTLVDFAPMREMSGFFKDKNLRLIRFDTLKNRLSFTNGVLNIPEMDINSSLGYIQMSGKQSVDLKMEYYVRVPLKMVTKAGLGSLFKQKPEDVDLAKVDEIEYVDKNKNIAFMNLKVAGKPGNIEVALGKDRSRRSRP